VPACSTQSTLLSSSPAARVIQQTALSQPRPWPVALFAAYARRYLRRHFHTIRLSISGPPPPADQQPLVIFSNHASWWDPLVGLFLIRTFYPHRHTFAPIDRLALKRYPFFKYLGFFPVEPGTTRGAVSFLNHARAVLQNPNSILWITPQGRFADPRERPPRFQAGLGHLAARVDRASFLPVAIEYVHWHERCPEILVRCGDLITPQSDPSTRSKATQWTSFFEQRLEQTQNALATESLRRDPTAFRTLLRGRTGVGGFYDLWRRLRTQLSGQRFDPHHGSL
jgi:1-acyl-sn-glycerol-3-phosphate acyltransferase